MATVGSLRVNMRANTAHFDKKMGKSRKVLGKFSGATGMATKLLGGLAAALSIRAVVGWTRGTMAMMDATGKMADRLKMATEDLVGFRHAAKITGVENAALDKSLHMFVRRLGEVRMGTGEAKDALEALGLQADDLVALDPAKAFRIVADQIKKLPNAADKAAAAYKLFGRQGQMMLNMLELGAAGLDKMQREAEDLGLTFSRVDAAKIEEANDALTRMQGSWASIGRTLAIEVAPYIEGIAALMTDIARLQKQNTRAEGRMSDALVKERGSPDALRRAIDLDIKAAAAKIEQAKKWLDQRYRVGWTIRETFAQGGWRLSPEEKGKRDAARADKVIAGQRKRMEDLLRMRRKLDAGESLLPASVVDRTLNGDGASALDGLKGILGEAKVMIRQHFWRDVAKEHAKQIEKLKEQTDALKERAKQASLEARTPLDQYKDRLKEIIKLSKHGLDYGSAGRLAKRAMDQYAATLAEGKSGGGRYEVLQSARVSLSGLAQADLKTPMQQALEEAKRQTVHMASASASLTRLLDEGGLN